MNIKTIKQNYKGYTISMFKTDFETSYEVLCNNKYVTNEYVSLPSADAAKKFIDRLVTGEEPFSYTIDEVFTYADGTSEYITVTGSEFFPCEMFEFNKECAEKMLWNDYNDWIAGTEPDGWWDEAIEVCIVGYFWGGKIQRGNTLARVFDDCAEICVKGGKENEQV